MKFLTDINVSNKFVLVRVDFNVPLGEDGRVDKTEDWRLKAVLPTIDYLLKQKAKIILLSHLGRPKGREVKRLRLDPIAGRLEKLLSKKVIKLNECLGSGVKREVEKLLPGQIVLLENLRFHKEEKENKADFAKKLSQLAEVYVNDAFGNSHRAHASIVSIPKYLPSCAGLLLKKEIEVLTKVLDKPKHPLTVIIGGVKIATKIKMIRSFLKKADSLLLGGALANTVICAKGVCIGRSVVDEAMIDGVKQLDLANARLHLPVDAVVSTSPSGRAPIRIAPIGKTREREMILDIGPDSILLFKEIIEQAKTIIWNGPMGLIERKEFTKGTKAIARAVAQSSAFSVIGGGETVSLLARLNLLGKIDHVSTGGGAMLKFLSKEKLPGIKALET